MVRYIILFPVEARGRPDDSQEEKKKKRCRFFRRERSNNPDCLAPHRALAPAGVLNVAHTPSGIAYLASFATFLPPSLPCHPFHHWVAPLLCSPSPLLLIPLRLLFLLSLPFSLLSLRPLCLKMMFVNTYYPFLLFCLFDFPLFHATIFPLLCPFL